MKLLFDENLSPKLPRLLATEFSNSLHVRDIGMKGFSDELIWEYAKNNNFTVISKLDSAKFIDTIWVNDYAVKVGIWGFGEGASLAARNLGKSRLGGLWRKILWA